MLQCCQNREVEMSIWGIYPPTSANGSPPRSRLPLILLVDVGDQRSLCVVKDQLVGNPKRKV
jgi:hypothetical protein